MRITLKILFIIVYSQSLFGQCSDAGVCAIGSYDYSLKHKISAGYSFGISGEEDDLKFHSIQVEGNIAIIESSKLILLFPWTLISGPLGSVSGPGDLILLLNQTLLQNSGNRFILQFGGKFATGLSNEKNLPQAYQPGSGTNDLIAGITYEINPWIFSAGYQLSRGRSSNEAIRLKRGDDLLLRAGHKTHLEIFEIGTELLAIKRLHKSTIRNPISPGTDNYITIPESDQFQINFVGNISYPVNESSIIQGMIAVPFLKREVDVDGLKRAFGFSITAQFSFSI